MSAKDYQVDLDPPQYGPKNLATELYNMIRGVPKAYQEGKANEFANQKAQWEQDVERPYKTKALERADVIGGIQTKDALDVYNNPPQMPGDLHGADAGEPSPAQRLAQNTGGAKPGGQFTVADLLKGASGIADQPNAVRNLERILQVEPGARLNAQQEQAVRDYVARDAQGDDNLTGSTGPSGLPPDPRTQAPPNLQPGMMGGPPNLAPGSPQGPVPMMSGAAYGGPPGAPQGPPGAPQGPPGAPPGTAVAQAGPPSLAGGLAPYVRPQQPAPAAGPEAPWNQGRIKQALTDADRLDDVAARPGMTAFPGRAAALKEKAKALREEAKQAQEALNKNLERTTEQKNALPGQTPQESAASAAAMKVQAEAQADNLKTRLAGYKPARDSIQVLDEMKDAFKAGGSHIATGPGAPNWLKVKQSVNNMAGTDIFKGVPESEQIDKLNAYLSAAVAKSMTARPTQYEFKAFQQQNPGLLTSPKGSENLMDILRQTKVQEAELARMASKFKVGGGQDWLDVEEKYFWEHPIISPLTKKPIDAQQAKDGKWYRLNPMTGKYAVE